MKQSDSFTTNFMHLHFPETAQNIHLDESTHDDCILISIWNFGCSFETKLTVKGAQEFADALQIVVNNMKTHKESTAAMALNA